MLTDSTSPPDQKTSDPRILYLLLAEHAPLPMVVVEGPLHSLRYVNPPFCQLMEEPKEAFTGKAFDETMLGNDECLSVLDKVYSTGIAQTRTGQFRGVRRFDTWAYTAWPVVTHSQPVGVMIQIVEATKFQERMIEVNEALILGSLRQNELTKSAETLNTQLQAEIVARKNAERALREAQAQLADGARQLDQAVSERTTALKATAAQLSATNQKLETFVYAIAHDLRAPLRTMRGFSDLLLEDETALNETSKLYAERINKAAGFMEMMLTDLLAFSRMSNAHVEYAWMSLETIVNITLSRLESDIQEIKAQVAPHGPWPNVWAHEATLVQILFNLISNALKFVRPGVSPVIRIRAEEQGEFARVWVEDNGVGIEREDFEVIFGLFNRLHGNSYPGTGLGLAIVQRGIERLGGRVGVESTPGQGSRFWIDLRREDNERAKLIIQPEHEGFRRL